MAVPDWRSLIEAAIKTRPSPIQAMTYGGMKWPTGSQPALLRCSDQADYVVKGKQVGKQRLLAEQVVGALGAILGAPVPKMPLVDISADLIANENEIKYMQAGIGHGCLYLADGVVQSWVNNQNVPENKDRHARIAVLYGWVEPVDKQLHYELSKKQLAWSVDHGQFNVLGGRGTPYPDMVRDGRLSPEDLAAVKPVLESIGPESIAKAVASPHESWGIHIEERISIAQHLEVKRVELVASLKKG
jgi:hypothetical protein